MGASWHKVATTEAGSQKERAPDIIEGSRFLVEIGLVNFDFSADNELDSLVVSRETREMGNRRRLVSVAVLADR